MFEDQYKLYEVGEHEWGMLTISDNILEELSELNCNKHMDHLDPLRHFFQQPHVSEVEVKSRCTNGRFRLGLAM
jgi:hypothetical protein